MRYKAKAGRLSGVMIRIGAVTDIFGLQGELKVKPLVDDKRIFKKTKSVTVVSKAGQRAEKDLLSAKEHKGLWLVRLSGVTNPDEGLLLKGSVLQIHDSELPEAGKDEVYWADIKGAKVIDGNGSPVGTLADYIETGATDVFQIAGEDGVDYLISNNPNHVLKIDTETKTVTIDRDGLVAQ